MRTMNKHNKQWRNLVLINMNKCFVYSCKFEQLISQIFVSFISTCCTVFPILIFQKIIFIGVHLIFTYASRINRYQVLRVWLKKKMLLRLLIKSNTILFFNPNYFIAWLLFYAFYSCIFFLHTMCITLITKVTR